MNQILLRKNQVKTEYDLAFETKILVLVFAHKLLCEDCIVVENLFQNLAVEACKPILVDHLKEKHCRCQFGEYAICWTEQ